MIYIGMDIIGNDIIDMILISTYICGGRRNRLYTYTSATVSGLYTCTSATVSVTPCRCIYIYM